MDIIGTSGDDVLNGTTDNDSISGGAGNDLLLGLGGRDLLQGDAGDDELQGGAGIDTLVGGDGLDLLIGGNGNDIYRINLADHDVIFDESGTDTVEFSYAGPLSSLWLSGKPENPGALYLNDSQGGSLQMIGDTGTPIESFKINGTTYSFAQLLALIGSGPLHLVGTEAGDLLLGAGADDVLEGLEGDDSLQGGGGSDILLGGEGADELAGGSGNDTLVGGAGGDIYVYNLGDGSDLIDDQVESGSVDLNVLSFGAGIQASNTVFARDGDDYVFRIGGVEVVRVTGTGDLAETPETHIEEVRFAEGNVIWNAAEVLRQAQTFLSSEADDAILATKFADTLRGFGGDDTLTGLDGNDVLEGGADVDLLNGGTGSNFLDGGTGDDIYHVARETSYQFYNWGTGTWVTVDPDEQTRVQNIISSADAAANKLDVLRFDYQSHEMIYYRDGEDLVFRAVLDNSETRIANFYSASNPTKIEEVRFIDGVSIDPQTLVVSNVNGSAGPDSLMGIAGSDVIKASGGNDAVWAGDGADSVEGGDGDDSIAGEGGNDYVAGGAGNDYLDGGTGWDKLIGGAGDDTYVIDAPESWYEVPSPEGGGDFYSTYGGDKIVERENEGTDTVIVLYDDFDLPTHFENLFLGTGVIEAYGNEQANYILGNEQRNYLSGRDGDDTIDGGAERDHMFGDAGNDTYIVSQANESEWIGEDEDEGIDTVVAALNFELPDNVENLTLVVAANGNKNFTGTGNNLNNYLLGTAGNNTLNGLQGDDTLDGGAGRDTMIGGVGNDTYFVDVASEVVTELPGQGQDTVKSSIDYILGADVERLVLLNGALNGDGNSAANELLGNVANNTLRGMDGLDTLYGGAGNDNLQGGNGSDTYRYDLGDGQDSITETAGTDIIEFGSGITAASVTVTRVGDHLHLTLDAGNRIAVQNFFSNNANRIEEVRFAEGGVVWDEEELSRMIDTNDPPVLSIPIGDRDINEDQQFIFDLPPGTFTDSDPGDVLSLSASLVNGSALPTWLSFDPQTGRFSGTPLNGDVGSLNIRVTARDLNNDTAYDDFNLDIDNVNDAPIAGSSPTNQLASVGTQFSYQLPPSLFSDVDAGDMLTWQVRLSNGDPLPGWLSFDPAARILSGNPGAGNVGTLNLSVRVADIAGATASQAFTLQVSNVVPITGNSSANTLTGGAGHDTIDGKGGNDTLYGLGGNDSLIGGTGNDSMVGGQGDDIYTVTETGDSVTENAGEGIDTVKSSLSTYTLGNNIEILNLSGTAATGIGNNLDNRLIGNSSANTLEGRDGNDWLDGAAGNDVLIGGNGNDTYVYASGDTLTELTGGGEDTVETTATYALVNNFENLISTYTGTSGRKETGNDANNLIRGSNSAVDTIAGAGGNDILEGAGGNDKISDAAGKNLLNGQAGNDSLTGSSGNEIFVGGKGNDTIATGTGADLILFNAGDGQDIVTASTGADNTISLGGVSYGNLYLQRSGNDLILKTAGTGSSEGIIFDDWYASGSNRSVVKLQVVAGTGGSGDMADNPVETFNFAAIVADFDASGAGTAAWAMMNAMDARPAGGYNTAAMGGDLAYQYATIGDFHNVGTLGAQSVLSGLGSVEQDFLSASALQQGALFLS